MNSMTYTRIFRFRYCKPRFARFLWALVPRGVLSGVMPVKRMFTDIRYCKLPLAFLLVWFVAAAQAQIVSRPHTLEDYPSVYLYSGDHTDHWEGWKERITSADTLWTDDPSGNGDMIIGEIIVTTAFFESPELDLSQAQWPVLLCRAVEECIYISTDGGMNYEQYPLTSEVFILPKGKNVRIAFETYGMDLPLLYAYVIDMPLSDPAIYAEPEIEVLKGTVDRGKISFGELQTDGSYKGEFECVIRAKDLATHHNSVLYIQYDTDITSATYLFRVGGEYIEVDGNRGVGYDGGFPAFVPPGTDEIRVTLAGEGSSKCVVYIPEIRQLQFKRGIGGLETDRSRFYDVDNDGLMEWVHNWNGGLYRFSADWMSSETVNPSLANGDDIRDFKWVNLDNDGEIDFYNPNLGGSVYAMSGMKAEKVYNGEAGSALNPLDYDNDGRPDFIIRGTAASNIKRGRVLSSDMKGNWGQGYIPVLTPEEYAGVEKELQLSSGGYTSPPGMGDMIGRDGWGDNLADTYGNFSPMDLNGDGVMDFVDGDNGYIYQSVGDGRLVEQRLGTQLNFCDFNNDGLADYVFYDEETKTVTASLSERDGSRKELKVISGVYCTGKLFCRDYDKDGDIDIIVPVDYSVRGDRAHNYPVYTNGLSFLVLMENKGNGTFKKHEQSISGEVYFFDCLDLDADGRYEVVSVIKDGRKKSHVVTYKIDGQKVADSPVLLCQSVNISLPVAKGEHAPLLLADIDHSGVTRMILSGELHDLNGKVNEAPSAPSSLSYTYDEKKQWLRMSWTNGTDRESPVADLTYALRVGTSPEAGDMLYAHAHPDGKRLDFSEGNCGRERMRTLNVSTWPAGKYYISVQAVDPNCQGSPFSECVVFEKKTPEIGFTLSYKSVPTPVETCTVALRRHKNPDYIYTWDLDGAEVVDTEADGEIMHLRFNSCGKKIIRLQVSDAKGDVFGMAEDSLVVVGANVVGSMVEMEGVYSWNAWEALDLDEDGTQELVERKIYECGTGQKYTPVKYLYNTNFPYYSKWKAIDFNQDGMADLWGVDGKKASLLINEEDKQMAVGEPYVLSYEMYGPIADLNNDGLLDIVGAEGFYNADEYMYSYIIYLNSGDYQVFLKQEETGAYGKESTLLLADYNKDGLLDIIGGSGGANSLNLNNGDNTFTVTPAFEAINAEQKFSIGGNTEMADIDGDGLWDFAGTRAAYGWGIYSYDKELTVIWGDGTKTVVPCKDERPFYYVSKVFDFDNNGCLDVFMMCHDSQSGNNFPTVPCIVFFNPDRSYTVSFVDGSATGLEYYLKDGQLAMENNMIKAKGNTQPLAPTHLRAVQDGKAVTIAWNHSEDKETPAELMRYNISVKHKGMSGEWAYLISPLNSGKDGVLLPTSARLIEGNRYTIPISNIPPGEYEVRVQGVDRWNMPSPFSEVYLLTVTASGHIEMPVSAVVHKEVEVKVLGNAGQAVDFGQDAVVTKQVGNRYWVSWNSSGQKKVSINGSPVGHVYVYPLPEGAFSLPEQVLLGATVKVSCSDAYKGKWMFSLNGGDAEPVDSSDVVKLTVFNDNTVYLVFNRIGEYELLREVGDDFNSTTYRSETIVGEVLARPEIASVGIEPESGKYSIRWDSGKIVPDATCIHIYKEGSKFNEFYLLASVSPENSGYTDVSSRPDISSARYKISCGLPYGETVMSDAHQPIHVMINRGIGSALNLSWSRYEGLEVQTYGVLGGTTPENLEMIAQVSGNMSSYSIPEAGTLEYYAIEPIFAKPVERASSRAVSRFGSSWSNVVSVVEASMIKMTEEVVILSETGTFEMDAQIEGNELQLMAFIYPTTAELRLVDWIVTDGEGKATVTRNGKFIAHENGVYTIRANAVDGSGIYGEVQVKVSGITGVDSYKSDKVNIVLESAVIDDCLHVKGIPTNGEGVIVRIYSMDGVLKKSEIVRQTETTVNCSDLSRGIYVCCVETSGNRVALRFVKK